MRPFSPSAEVKGGGGSPAWPGAISDFGADDPFAGAAGKLKEH
jgi:hypothetical protein